METITYNKFNEVIGGEGFSTQLRPTDPNLSLKQLTGHGSIFYYEETDIDKRLYDISTRLDNIISKVYLVSAEAGLIPNSNYSATSIRRELRVFWEEIYDTIKELLKLYLNPDVLSNSDNIFNLPEISPYHDSFAKYVPNNNLFSCLNKTFLGSDFRSTPTYGHECDLMIIFFVNLSLSGLLASSYVYHREGHKISIPAATLCSMIQVIKSAFGFLDRTFVETRDIKSESFTTTRAGSLCGSVRKIDNATSTVPITGFPIAILDAASGSPVYRAILFNEALSRYIGDLMFRGILSCVKLPAGAHSNYACRDQSSMIEWDSCEKMDRYLDSQYSFNSNIKPADNEEEADELNRRLDAVQDARKTFSALLGNESAAISYLPDSYTARRVALESASNAFLNAYNSSQVVHMFNPIPGPVLEPVLFRVEAGGASRCPQSSKFIEEIRKSCSLNLGDRSAYPTETIFMNHGVKGHNYSSSVRLYNLQRLATDVSRTTSSTLAGKTVRELIYYIFMALISDDVNTLNLISSDTSKYTSNTIKDFFEAIQHNDDKDAINFAKALTDDFINSTYASLNIQNFAITLYSARNANLASSVHCPHTKISLIGNHPTAPLLSHKIKTLGHVDKKMTSISDGTYLFYNLIQCISQSIFFWESDHEESFKCKMKRDENGNIKYWGKLVKVTKSCQISIPNSHGVDLMVYDITTKEILSKSIKTNPLTITKCSYKSLLLLPKKYFENVAAPGSAKSSEKTSDTSATKPDTGSPKTYDIKIKVDTDSGRSFYIAEDIIAGSINNCKNPVNITEDNDNYIIIPVSVCSDLSK